MRPARGVEILLPLGTPTPRWIRQRAKRFSRPRRYIGRHLVSCLELPDAQAMFIPGGEVVVKLPHGRSFRVAFDPLVVLEIRDRHGELLKRNHCLCMRCAQNSGQVVSIKPGTVSGRSVVDYECTTPGCRHRWMWPNI